MHYDDETGTEEHDERKGLEVPKLDKYADNIAEQMTDEQRKQLGRIVCDDTQADIDSRAEMAERWNQQGLLYVGRPKQSPLGERNDAPNLDVSTASVAIDQYTARASKFLFPSMNIAKALGTGREDDSRAYRVARTQNLQLERPEARFRRTGELTIKGSTLFGMAAFKAWWDPEDEVPVVAHVPAEDFIVSHTYTGTVQNAQRLTHRLYMTRDEVRARVNDGLFCKDCWDLKSDDPSARDREALAETRNELDGVDDVIDVSEPGPMEIYEQHRTLDLDGDGIGEKYVVTVHKASRKVMRIVGYEVQGRDGTPETLPCPFVPLEFDFNPLGFYSLGIGAKTEGLSVLQNSIANINLFAGIRNTFPPKFCTKNAFKRPGQQHYELDEWIEAEMRVEDLQKAMFIAPTVPPSPVLREMAEMADYRVRERVSLTDVMQGMKQPHNQAAETTRIIEQQSAEMFNGSFRRMLDGLTDLLQLLYTLNRIYLSDEKYNAMLGDTGQPEYQQWQAEQAQYQQMVGMLFQQLDSGMPPDPQLLMALQQMPPPRQFPFSVAEDFADGMDIIPSADPYLTSESERVGAAERTLQLVTQGPEQPPPQAVYAAKKALLEAMRVPAQLITEALIEPPKPEPPPNYSPQEALVAMLRGLPVTVLPDQDHESYIQAIEAYKQRDGGAWWQNTDAATREAIERHKQERMAAVLEQEAQSGQQIPVPALAGGAAPEGPIVPGGAAVGAPPNGSMVLG